MCLRWCSLGCWQRVLVDNSGFLTFPLTIVSSVEIIPGMAVFMVAAPVRARTCSLLTVPFADGAVC